jgi:microcystin-dependent protein
MSQPFIGEIRGTSFSVVPRGWAPCNGQLLSIAQNQALFAILGTTYGGDGVTTFALPNLQGRVPVGTGNGVQLGQSDGSTQVTLLTTQIPAHNHTLMASNTAGAADPTNQGPAGAKAYGPATSLTGFDGSSIAPTGGSQPHNNMQPYLTVNYIIALTGIFPSKN